MSAVSASQHPYTPPLGYRGIRGAVLSELKRSEGLTTREIATRLGASLNTVRYHLRELEGQELVQYERQHRGVGAPAFAYRLTPAGEALFPNRYEATLTNLLAQLAQRDGRAATVALLETRYHALAEQLQQELGDAAPEDRLAALARLLSDDGYMAQATVSGSMATLIEHNCAIRLVAEQFPEICAAEAKFLSTVLGGAVNRERHILGGCSACEYRVNFEERHAPKEENA